MHTPCRRYRCCGEGTRPSNIDTYAHTQCKSHTRTHTVQEVQMLQGGTFTVLSGLLPTSHLWGAVCARDPQSACMHVRLSPRSAGCSCNVHACTRPSRASIRLPETVLALDSLHTCVSIPGQDNSPGRSKACKHRRPKQKQNQQRHKLASAHPTHAHCHPCKAKCQ